MICIWLLLSKFKSIIRLEPNGFGLTSNLYSTGSNLGIDVTIVSFFPSRKDQLNVTYVN